MTKAVIIILIISDLILPKSLALKIEDHFIKNNPENGQKIAVTLTNQVKGKPISIHKTPSKVNEQSIYSGSSEIIYAIDLNTNFVLTDKNGQQKFPMASLTKLMTAHIAFNELDLNKIVTVPNYNLNSKDSRMGLIPGEKMSVRDLLYGLLVQSAGDAALTLAKEISGNDTEFAKLMNAKAKEIDLTDTNFTNSIGIDDFNHHSTAKDLAGLTRTLILKTDFRNMVSSKSYIAKSESGLTHALENTNKLLDNKLVFGVKTGKTDAAGECLISLAKVGDHEILTVVMGSANRFTETQNLINWIKVNYKW
ncbi:TPA: hypothetical protein DDW69_02205 [candidate division CPR2 bacterium]|uniref:Serine-type D-Ala-D-Ala carboxypeptidase, D-alanyl-D-alanine carboxypeptidase (Penicillin-binding protein 5/6) n=1 Tax=candidate division CPR2 bacterium GW2011_GWC1_41_48 TaxID=1618344 RepID=A0A0G0WA03_UNCC2|nr:MAG: serine-type D-Ala-D-Ala carboxypeptidase [candidate division CPR2 bacterium GW2011_GWC2_39_35]KKR28008.1 MAG: serine-type D-Ala-D-Ala carboxypeptidase [candidate division CPR2 bacterium GW2011_GWD2_39_7]KKR28414.1 MAG: serine-type D-Ala-D-Ala carboxypeptidase [candidate division CPR2 bacterium GW2011_GWD1_39_7]KKS09839.1 MAG: serine-type D-Ala-D-Ala carboxypeptidase, D-alanyl-D-alanine carboxypeptidase (penicillin-binding protein 5/6) [candidate division CPR2 bacterium GW2011_GWC1_41_48]